jgi:hypothetical protein
VAEAEVFETTPEDCVEAAENHRIDQGQGLEEWRVGSSRHDRKDAAEAVAYAENPAQAAIAHRAAEITGEIPPRGNPRWITTGP